MITQFLTRGITRNQANYFVIHGVLFKQARSHQLLMHNRDMLDQMAQLVARLQELELKVNGTVNTAGLEHVLPPPPTLQVQGHVSQSYAHDKMFPIKDRLMLKCIRYYSM